jgi:hypothetical protein
MVSKKIVHIFVILIILINFSIRTIMSPLLSSLVPQQKKLCQVVSSLAWDWLVETIPGNGQHGLARLAQPGPKFMGQAWPDHASGPSLGLDFVRFTEAARPKARRPFYVMGWAWAYFFCPTVGPGPRFPVSGFGRPGPRPGPALEMLRYSWNK